MVSSFLIRTNITVPVDVAEEFNNLGEDDPITDTDLTTPDYFDTHTDDDALPRLDPPIVSETVYYDSWEIDVDSGLLYDACEKFHGALRVLHYRIETFFEPRGIKLNGTIVGVNDEHPMCYVYNVINNVIKLDVDATLASLESLRRDNTGYVRRQILDTHVPRL
jgi:hypothetical protein